MVSVRRIYIYLVAAISLLAAAAAIVTLLQNLIPPSPPIPITVTALLIAVIVIALPFYLVHWLWAQRLAARDQEERGSLIRRIYLFALLAIFLGGFLANGYYLVSSILRLILRLETPNIPFGGTTASPLELVLNAAVAMIVAILLWVYHELVVRGDDHALSDAEHAPSVRRVYIYGFATLGLIMTVWGISQLLRLVFHQIGGGNSINSDLQTLVGEVARVVIGLPVGIIFWRWGQRDDRAMPYAGPAAAVRRVYIYGFATFGLIMAGGGISQILRLVLYQIGGSNFSNSEWRTLGDQVALIAIGLPLWIIFWRWGQQLFDRNDDDRESTIRKLYLYVVVFVAATITISLATVIFAGVLRGALGLDVSGDLRDPLAIIIVAALIWAFHWFVLRQETALADESERQAGLRRLYWYLVAAIGLGAFLNGLTGVVSVLISTATTQIFGDGQKELLAWSTAALIAGLPVWLIPWRFAQSLAVREDARGAQERRSIVRKGYLYLYLLLASLTILGSAIFILARLLSLVLGDRSGGNLLSELAYPFAYALIAAGVWAIHGLALRGDGARFQAEQNARRAEFSIGIVDEGEAKFGNALVAELNRTLPGLTIVPQGFGTPASGENAPSLAQAKVIVGAWTMFASESARASDALKLIVPTPLEGAQWIGVDAANAQALASEAARAVKRMIEGESAKTRRGLHPAVIIVLVLIGLCVLLSLLSALRGFLGVF